jgi:hypothetical protein
MLKTATALELLEEQAEILTRLEALLDADERRLAAGDTDASPRPSDPARTRLLAQLEEISVLLGDVRTSGEERHAGEERLERSNRTRARDLMGRTAALVSAWRGRRDAVAGELREVREGRTILAGYTAAGKGAAAFDVKR